MKKTLILAALLLLPTPVWAQRVNQLPSQTLQSAGAPSSAVGTSIAAVVNDNVVTTTDLDQRMRLAILSSGLPDTSEVRMHLLPQILRGLIDEQLQNQEAKRLDLSVTSAEVDQAMARIAHDNNIPGDMRQYIAAHGGSPEALSDQIRSGLLWNKVIQHELRPHVEVGDDEVDSVIARIKADAGKQEYLVSEIYLSVDTPKDEDQVHQLADRLVQQIKSGANFAAVARQFSQGTGASQGGDLGWIQQGQLAPELNHALSAAAPGEVSDPIRTANGYHILGVRQKRTVSLGDPDKASVNLMQAFRPYGPNADKALVMQDAAHIKASGKTCATVDSIPIGFPGWKIQKLGDMNLSKAPPWLADKVRGVAVGGTSEPLATDKGAALLFVCSRNDGGDIDREAITRSIGTEKLELQARRLIRDLYRTAYLDIRIGKNS